MRRLIYLCALIAQVVCDSILIHRKPRFVGIPFPPGGGNKIQVIAGFGIPVELDQDSLTFALILKTNYQLPTNSSEFTQPENAYAESKGSTTPSEFSRWGLYNALVTAAEKLSLGGRDCLLRSICQSAYSPLHHDGLLGEILHIIFSPSTTPDETHPTQHEYERAERLGEQATEDDECEAYFPKCSNSLLDLISMAPSVGEALLMSTG